EGHCKRRDLVGFSLLELLDNCCNKEIFARKNFGVKSCWRGGYENWSDRVLGTRKGIAPKGKEKFLKRILSLRRDSIRKIG
ncbi:MAG: hypothetical protein DRR19_28595, partial [Candidatus Parabeggiatoa sp. nov. 1]